MLVAPHEELADFLGANKFDSESQSFSFFEHWKFSLVPELLLNGIAFFSPFSVLCTRFSFPSLWWQPCAVSDVVYRTFWMFSGNPDLYVMLLDHIDDCIEWLIHFIPLPLLCPAYIVLSVALWFSSDRYISRIDSATSWSTLTEHFWTISSSYKYLLNALPYHSYVSTALFQLN